MERTSFAILFYVRDSRIRKDGTAAIEVSLTVNGARSFFSTGKARGSVCRIGTNPDNS